MFKNITIEGSYSGKFDDKMIISIKCLSSIKMGHNLKVLFENHIFEILESVVSQNLKRNVDLNAAENVQLISSLITAVNTKGHKATN